MTTVTVPPITDFEATYNDLPASLQNLGYNTEAQWSQEDRKKRQHYLDRKVKMADPGPRFYNKTVRRNFFAVLKYIHDNHHPVEKLMGMPLREAREEAGKIVHQGMADARIKINYYGKTAHELGYDTVLTVSDHKGWLDGLILFARTGLAGAGKTGSFNSSKIVDRVFGLGGYGYQGMGAIVEAAKLAYIPVERTGGSSLKSIFSGLFGLKKDDKKEMEMNARQAMYGDNKGAKSGISIFLTGTTSHGHEIPIAPSSTATRALFVEDYNKKDLTTPIKGAVIQPVVITINTVEGQKVIAGQYDAKRDKYSWYGGNARSMFAHFAGNTMPACQNGGIELDVYFLPPIELEKLVEQGIEVNQRAVTNIAYNQIAEVLKLSKEEIMSPANNDVTPRLPAAGNFQMVYGS